jgi:hypothetical protein
MVRRLSLEARCGRLQEAGRSPAEACSAALSRSPRRSPERLSGAFWIAPRSRRRLSDPARLALEVALFVLGGASLFVVWGPPPSVVFTVASIVVAVLTRRVGEPLPHMR